MKRFNLIEYLKNPSRKVVTRNGKPVRILCTDFKNKIYPVLGAIDRGSIEDIQLYTANGEFSLDSENEEDIYLEPAKYQGWINIYRYKDTGDFISGRDIYPTEIDAALCPENIQNAIWLATIQIEWAE